MPATLAEIQARRAALQAERADYRAVLAAINALGEDQRELSGRMGSVETGLAAVESRLGAVEESIDDTATRVRSVEEGVAEMRDLLFVFSTGDATPLPPAEGVGEIAILVERRAKGHYRRTKTQSAADR